MTRQLAEAKRWAPEKIAAIVNGGALVVLPCTLVAWSWWTSRGSTAVTTRLDEARAAATAIGLWMVVFFPPACIAAWRTHVHAKCYLSNQGGVWRGVVEAAALGFVLPLIIVGRALVTYSLPALLYAVAYGVIGLMAGLTIGLVLQVVALLVLRITTHARRRLPSGVDGQESSSGI